MGKGQGTIYKAEDETTCIYMFRKIPLWQED